MKAAVKARGALIDAEVGRVLGSAATPMQAMDAN
jgi:hypothetical protein